MLFTVVNVKRREFVGGIKKMFVASVTLHNPSGGKTRLDGGNFPASNDCV